MRESLKSEHWKKEYDTAYQRRWLSFIGERMFSWWCYCQHIGGVKVASVPVKIYENFKGITDQEERMMTPEQARLKMEAALHAGSNGI